MDYNELPQGDEPRGNTPAGELSHGNLDPSGSAPPTLKDLSHDGLVRYRANNIRDLQEILEGLIAAYKSAAKSEEQDVSPQQVSRLREIRLCTRLIDAIVHTRLKGASLPRESKVEPDEADEISEVSVGTFLLAISQYAKELFPDDDERARQLIERIVEEFDKAFNLVGTSSSGKEN
jgi:hypothetical protein